MPGSDRTLTFGGKPSIIIPPGASVVSDEVDLEVPPLSDLAISIFVPEHRASLVAFRGAAIHAMFRRQGTIQQVPCCRLPRPWQRGSGSQA